MKIKETFYDDQDDYRAGYKIQVETDREKREVSFLEGEPEDATLGRDYEGVYSIGDLMAMAYNAGVAGEPLERVTAEVEDLEEW